VRLVGAFGRFWWDFIVGDDWRTAAGIAAILMGGALLVAYSSLSDTAITLLSGGAIVALVGCSIVFEAQRERREAARTHD
jgi:hypothetical protein